MMRKKLLLPLCFISLISNTSTRAQQLLTGAINGAFDVSNLGAATYTIPIAVPDGIGGMQPAIAVTYNSQNRSNGILGVGWSLSSTSIISRSANTILLDGKTKGPNMTANDRFAIDGNRLVRIGNLSSQTNFSFGTEVESFQKIDATGSAGEPTIFTVTGSSGVHNTYGPAANSRLVINGKPFSWYLSSSTDLNGNAVLYQYTNTAGQEIRLANIRYGDLNAGDAQRNRIIFHYEAKAEPNFFYLAGAKIESNVRLHRITIESHGGNNSYATLYSYIFEYAPQKDQLIRVRHLSNVSTNGNISPTPVAEMPATDLLYENIVPNNVTSTMVQQVSASHEDVVIGDFNGDGKSDFIRYDNGANSANSPGTLQLNNGVADFPLTQLLSIPVVPEHLKKGNFHYDRLNRSSFFDFNGDGREDFFTIKPSYTDANGYHYGAHEAPTNSIEYLNEFRLYISSINSSYTGGIQLEEDPNGKITRGATTTDLYASYPLVGDFDGDGKSEILILEKFKLTTDPDYKAYLFGDRYRPAPGSGSSHPNAAVGLTPPFTAKDVEHASEWQRSKFFVIDYNGDGRSDILFIKEGTAKVYEFNISFNAAGNPMIGNPSFIEVSSGGYPTSAHEVYTGDFNGDGIIDVLTYVSGAGWEIGYGRGNGFFNDIRSLTSLNMNGTPCGSTNAFRSIIVADFDGDGRSDIFDATRPGASCPTHSPRIHFSKGGHTFQTQNYNIDASQLGFGPGMTKVGDFDGDGHVDLIARHINNTPYNFYVHKFNSFDYSTLLTKVVNGLGVSTRVDYSKNTKEYFPLYNNSSYFTNVTYPLVSKNMPIPLVRSIYYDNGQRLDTENRIDYSYDKLTFGQLGRGMLGFQQITVQDITQQTTVVNNFSTTDITGTPYNGLLLLPHSTTTTKAGILTGSSRSRYDVQELGASRFWPFIRIKEDYDNVSLQNAREEHIYEEAVPGGGSGSSSSASTQETGLEAELSEGSVQPANSTIIESTYHVGKPKKIIYSKGFYRNPFFLWEISGALETVTQSFWYPGMNPMIIEPTPLPFHRYFLPSRIYTLSQHRGQPAVGDDVHFTYNNAKGWLTQKRDNQGTPQLVTTNYSYNNRGNLTGQTMSSAGCPTVTETIEYDPSHRYVRSRFNTSYPLLRSTNVYNGHTGWLRTATDDVNGITQTFSYDAFGRATNMTENTGLQKTTSITASVPGAPGNTRYTVSEFNNMTNNYLRKHYDRLGRLLRTARVDFNGEILFEDVTYNNLGQVTSTSMPYKQNGGTPINTTFNYDNLGRQTQVTAPNGNTMFSYHAVANSSPTNNLSNYTVSTTTPDGMTRASVADAAGKQIQATDPGGTLAYTYHSSGQLMNTKLNGDIVTSSEYDAFGREIKKGDANYGFYQYTYDNYGNLKTQTDPKGNQYTLNYDALGNLISKTGPEGSYTYTYNLTASGNSLGKLTSISAPDGISETYDYGAFGRLIQESKTIDGTTFNNTFGYDGWGRPSRKYFVNFLNGIVINFGYNINDGSYERTFLNGGTIQDPKNLYTVLKKNVLGQTSMTGMHSVFYSGTTPNPNENPFYRYNGLKGHSNTGLMISSVAWRPGVGNLSLSNYNFDVSNGNLTDRTDALRSAELEYFEYDDLNRLKSATAEAVGQLEDYQYTDNGNITQKSGTGTFSYDAANMVSEIGPYIDIPNETQIITYTPFDKVETIAEGNITAQFKYWPNGQRAKMEIKNNGVTIRTKYYMDDFEREIKNGQVRDLVYVRGEDDQYVAVIERVNNTNEKTYTILTDHLSSIERIIDNNSSTIVTDKSYDAWGRERDPFDLIHLPATRASDGWDRGYTGHEHIPEFGIINMNGRLYDPLFGRMLSPDPYIMGTDNTQGYNRYTYALNNPLSYTDPDGEWVQFVVGAVVGGFSGWQIGGALGKTGWDRFWYTLGGAAVGAASGGLGAAVSKAGGVAANTAGILFSSTVNAAGTSLYTGGKVSGNISIGVASYNLENGEFGYLGKKGNSRMQNIGYGFGALANVQDLFAGVRGVTAEYRAETRDIQHARLKGKYNSSNFDISVAHIEETNYKWTSRSDVGLLNNLDYARDWAFRIAKGKYYSGSEHGMNWKLYNINGKWLNTMSKRLGDGTNQGIGLWGIGKLKYGTTMFGCQSHVAHALWGVGIPTLPINFMPQVLYGQLLLRQFGIYASPILTNK